MKVILQKPKRHHDNLMKEERKALSPLRVRTDIVIKKADKGSATVVMECEDYISKVMSLLNNREHYRKLDENPTDIFIQEIKNVLSDMVNCRSIDKEIARGLLPADIRVSMFYILPKIHKPGNPGGLIVLSCGSPTEGISQFVDFHPGPLVRKIASYIKDMTDF